MLQKRAVIFSVVVLSFLIMNAIGVPKSMGDLFRGIASAQESYIISTVDGLTLTVGEDGTITELSHSTEDLSAGAVGGFFAEDVFAGSKRVQADVSVEKKGDTIGLVGEFPGLDLGFTAEIEYKASYIRIYGRVTDVSGTERGITVHFSVPLDADGWKWFDDISTSRTISGSTIFQNVSLVRAGKNGRTSLYPIGVVANDRYGVCLGLSPDYPRFHRIAYVPSEREFRIEVDFGLSPDTKNPSTADFEFFICSVDGAWGFRDGWSRYMDMYPNYFSKVAEEEGLWLPYVGPNTVPNIDDFGFKFFLIGGWHGRGWESQIPHARKHNMYVFRYSEPHRFWMPLPGEEYWNYASAVEEMERLKTLIYFGLASDKERESDRPLEAAGAILCGIYTAEDKYYMEFSTEPWNSGVMIPMNLDPDIKGTADYPGRADYILRFDTDNFGDFDGIYLDCIGAHMDMLNFRREHFKYADEPLVYDLKSKKVGILVEFSSYEFMKYAREKLHAANQMIFSNYIHPGAEKMPWLIMLSDIIGMEHGDIPDSKHLDFRRTLSGQKPVSLILSANFEQFDQHKMKEYFQVFMLYGMYPSVSGHLDGPWGKQLEYYLWEPKLRERDRELFKTYIPVINDVSAAGWEPVTRAVVNIDGVRVERFGKGSEFYFVVFNFDKTFHDNVRLTIQLDGIDPYALEIKDPIGDSVHDWRWNPEKSEIVFDIASREGRVFLVTRSDG